MESGLKDLSAKREQQMEVEKVDKQKKRPSTDNYRR